MQVVFTRQADYSLATDQNYYIKEVSEELAAKIINAILDDITDLQRLPNIGTTEERLVKSKFDYKYIVSSNYKIIFRIDGDIIYINDIFDGRQNPDKLERRNK